MLNKCGQAGQNYRFLVITHRIFIKNVFGACDIWRANCVEEERNGLGNLIRIHDTLFNLYEEVIFDKQCREGGLRVICGHLDFTSNRGRVQTKQGEVCLFWYREVASRFIVNSPRWQISYCNRFGVATLRVLIKNVVTCGQVRLANIVHDCANL